MAAFASIRAGLVAVLVASAAMLCPPGKATTHGSRRFSDDELKKRFSWVMHVNTRELKHYLSYPGARMKNLSKVQVDFKSFLHDKPEFGWQNQHYQDFIYCDRTPVGQRRHNQLNIPAGQVGAIIIESPTGDEAAPTDAITSVILRLFLELYHKHVMTGMVLVPDDQYDAISGALERYGFSKTYQPVDGPQMSISLRSDSSTDDRPFFYQQ
jgi:hypothetical protein